MCGSFHAPGCQRTTLCSQFSPSILPRVPGVKPSWFYPLYPLGHCTHPGSHFFSHLFFNIYFYIFNFMCMPECMWMHLICMAMEPSRGYQVLWNWNLRWLEATMWVRRVQPGPSGRAATALTSKSFFQPPVYFLRQWFIQPSLAFNLVHCLDWFQIPDSLWSLPLKW